MNWSKQTTLKNCIDQLPGIIRQKHGVQIIADDKSANHFLILDNGNLYGFGGNENRQISDSDTDFYDKPVLIAKNVVSAVVWEGYSAYTTLHGQFTVHGKTSYSNTHPDIVRVSRGWGKRRLLITDGEEFFEIDLSEYTAKENKVPSEEVLLHESWIYKTRVGGKEWFSDKGNIEERKWFRLYHDYNYTSFTKYTLFTDGKIKIDDTESNYLEIPGSVYDFEMLESGYFLASLEEDRSIVFGKADEGVLNQFKLPENVECFLAESKKTDMKFLNEEELELWNILKPESKSKVSAGANHTLILSNGNLYGFGFNTYGQICDSEKREYESPHFMAENVVCAAALRKSSVYVSGSGITYISDWDTYNVNNGLTLSGFFDYLNNCYTDIKDIFVTPYMHSMHIEQFFLVDTHGKLYGYTFSYFENDELGSFIGYRECKEIGTEETDGVCLYEEPNGFYHYKFYWGSKPIAKIIGSNVSGVKKICSLKENIFDIPSYVDDGYEYLREHGIQISKNLYDVVLLKNGEMYYSDKFGFFAQKRPCFYKNIEDFAISNSDSGRKITIITKDKQVVLGTIDTLFEGVKYKMCPRNINTINKVFKLPHDNSSDANKDDKLSSVLKSILK